MAVNRARGPVGKAFYQSSDVKPGSSNFRIASIHIDDPIFARYLSLSVSLATFVLPQSHSGITHVHRLSPAPDSESGERGIRKQGP